MLLGWRPEMVADAIRIGVQLPVSRMTVTLRATTLAGEVNIDDEDLDSFVAAFEREEPGRNPPVAVRRELLVEAGHACSICADSAPLQYHHILEFAELKHHDVRHMMAICGTCHSKITLKQIDVLAQRMYKERTATRRRLVSKATDALSGESLLRFSWEDLREVISQLSEASDRVPTHSSSDFTDLDLTRKNELNRLGADYFEMMRQHHEPYFGRIDRFLAEPVNEGQRDLYFRVVDELRTKLAAGRSNFASFEQALLRFVELAVDDKPSEMKPHRALLTILLSFMYFNCDIGRKS